MYTALNTAIRRKGTGLNQTFQSKNEGLVKTLFTVQRVHFLITKESVKYLILITVDLQKTSHFCFKDLSITPRTLLNNPTLILKLI